MGNFLYGLTYIARQPFKLIYPVKVIGPRKIEQKKSIFVMNHLSGWDPIMWFIWFRTRVHVLYKSAFDRKKILKSVLRRLENIPVRRGEADIEAVKSCIQLLEQDKILALFPEGTRNKDVDCLQEFKTGTAMLALKTHAPIRPFYIFDRLKPLCKNYIIVGEEFTLEQFYDKDITHQVLSEATAYVHGKVDELRIKLNEILTEKGIKRRKRTKKEELERKNFLAAKHDKEEKRRLILEGLDKNLPADTDAKSCPDNNTNETK